VARNARGLKIAKPPLHPSRATAALARRPLRTRYRSTAGPLTASRTVRSRSTGHQIANAVLGCGVAYRSRKHHFFYRDTGTTVKYTCKSLFLNRKVVPVNGISPAGTSRDSRDKPVSKMQNTLETRVNTNHCKYEIFLQLLNIIHMKTKKPALHRLFLAFQQRTPIFLAQMGSPRTAHRPGGGDFRRQPRRFQV